MGSRGEVSQICLYMRQRLTNEKLDNVEKRCHMSKNICDTSPRLPISIVYISHSFNFPQVVLWYMITFRGLSGLLINVVNDCSDFVTVVLAQSSEHILRESLCFYVWVVRENS